MRSLRQSQFFPRLDTKVKASMTGRAKYPHILVSGILKSAPRSIPGLFVGKFNNTLLSTGLTDWFDIRVTLKEALSDTTFYFFRMGFYALFVVFICCFRMFLSPLCRVFCILQSCSHCCHARAFIRTIPQSTWTLIVKWFLAFFTYSRSYNIIFMGIMPFCSTQFSAKTRTCSKRYIDCSTKLAWSFRTCKLAFGFHLSRERQSVFFTPVNALLANIRAGYSSDIICFKILLTSWAILYHWLLSPSFYCPNYSIKKVSCLC